VGANGRRVMEMPADGTFQLHLGCIPVAGEHLLASRTESQRSEFRRERPPVSPPRHLSQGDSRFGILLQGENVFHHNKVGCFFENRFKSREKMRSRRSAKATPAMW